MAEMNVKDEGSDKVDDVMLPGFRFHPTDEELVVFYLKKKIQQRPLAVELIKQLDIYKYDPWDLPRVASSGEKEWYFYCPRDRKYRNSARPNRVTESGFWKATGTDRPIYNSDATKCVGLKKSLVFYRGRAAKGIKTDWMMHEFRLPPSSASSASSPSQNQNQTSPQHKKPFDKSLPPNDAWAICRIFKKTNSIAQRALAHAWLAPFSEPTPPTQNTLFPNHETTISHNIYTPYTSDNVSCSTETGSTMHLSCQTNSNNPIFSPINHKEPIDYKPSFLSCKTNDDQYSCNFMFPQQDSVFNTASTQHNFDDFSMSSSPEIQDGIVNIENRADNVDNNYQWLNSKIMMSCPSTILGDTWNFLDCPSEISNTYSTSKYA